MSDDLPEHAENSPSSAEGWTNCPDYINANRGLPDDTSWEAAEGTVAHMISDECLATGRDADEFIGTTRHLPPWSFTWREDDASLLQRGIDRIRAIPGKFFGEQRVDITEIVGHDSLGRRQKGTLDRGVIGSEFILIEDLKWGRGVPVYAERCKQIAIYGLSFWQTIARHQTDVTDFVLSIDQPRHAGGGGEWRLSLAELQEFCAPITAAAEATRAPNPPRTAAPESCLWCRRKIAAGGCPTYETYILDLLTMDLDDLDAGSVKLPELLTPARRAVLIEHKKMIEKWLEQMEAKALTDYLEGRDAGGMKAVLGNKLPDKWIDEAAATAALQPRLAEKTFTTKLISPSQCAKAIPADDLDWLLLEPCLQRGERKPVLVPARDQRDAIITGAELDNL